MQVNEYQKQAMRTNDGKCTKRLIDKYEMIEFFKQAKGGKPCERYDLGGIINGCLGLSGELGEFNDIIKKWIFHEKPLDIEHAKKEVGDVLWYVAMICHSIGWDMETIMHMNIEKLNARYPEGFDTERSLHRQKGDI